MTMTSEKCSTCGGPTPCPNEWRGGGLPPRGKHAPFDPSLPRATTAGRLGPKPLSPTAKAERERCAALVRAGLARVHHDSAEGERLATILRQIERGPHAPWCPVKYREPCRCGIPDVEP